jgi:uroporphyrinogen-III synthase
VKALVTRPSEDAGPLAAALQGRGIEPVLEPLLTIRFAADGAAILAPLLDGAQAVLFTSANGARAFAAASARRDLAAFAVGDATAKAARDAGFADVASAGGDVAALAALVAARLKPESGVLVHAAASEVAGDLAGALSAKGFTLRRAVLYESLPAERLSDGTAAALASGEIDLALFFSPRTAEHFVRLATAAGLEGACRKVAAVALSPAVADRLRPLAWRAVHVADEPTLASLLAATDRAVAEGVPSHGSGGGSMTDERTEKVKAVPRGRGAWLSLTTLLLMIAAIGGAPYWVPLMPWATSPKQIKAIQARLDAADAAHRSNEQRIALLSAQPVPKPAPADTSALDALGRRVDALERRPQTPANPGPTQAVADALQKIDARLDALEARPSAPAAPAASAPPDTAALDALTQRVDALEHRAPAAGEAPDLQPLADALQKANTRLDGLETRLASVAAATTTAAAPHGDTGDIARFAALAGLRAALASGAPYRNELALVTSFGGDDKMAPAIGVLSHDAATGLPSRAILVDRFRTETAPAIRHASAAATAADDASLSARALARVKALVIIRRVGEGASADSDPVAAALAALDRDDLAAAVAALKPLSGAAGDAAKPWLALAQRRLAAEGAAADLEQLVGGRLAVGSEGH